MTFLPIVERELRVAARRASTYRVRWWAALIAMGMTFVSLALLSLSAGRNSGNPMFGLLSGYTFGVCLLAGVILTADALSEEKRAGTLGLLLLTRLKGHDVVLGKLMARSLNAFYALLALLPINALTMVFGGVTGVEFWRMSLAQANGLFVSLAAGICVSSLVTDAYRAMGFTLVLVLALAAGLPALAALGTSLGLSAGWMALTRVSPAFAYTFSNEANYLRHSGGFWTALMCSHLLGWTLLVFASLYLPRQGQVMTWFGPGIARWWQSRGRGKDVWRRMDLRVINPVLWLRQGELGIQWGAWAVVAIWGCLVLLVLLFSSGGAASAVIGGYGAKVFGFLLKVLFAFQAARFFAEGRQDGTLELLLCTPLADREILSGHNVALWRSFRAPLIAFLILLYAPVIVAVGSSTWAGNPTPLAHVLPAFFLNGIYSLRFAADLTAVCWFGTGLALTSKTPRLVPAYAILFVLVLPSVLCWLDVIADFIFIAWGVGKCRQDLRRRLGGQYQRGS